MNTPEDLKMHLDEITSRNGRYWLQSTRDAAASQLPQAQSSNDSTVNRSDSGHGAPFQSKQVQPIAFHESVVVAIPNVGDSPRVGDVGPLATPAVATAAAIAAPAMAMASAPVAPAPQKIESFTESPPLSHEAIDGAVSASRENQTENDRDAIAQIADQILQRFPAGMHSTILFVGSEDSVNVDETCARVAAELASRNSERVLLIDSDFEHHRLTTASGVNAHGGLSEIMNIALPWQDAILKSNSSRLDFLPAGSRAQDRWNPEQLLRQAHAEMQQHYRTICVSGGMAHNFATKTWSGFCDGSYLVVSVQQSNDVVAKSSVARLQSLNARLIGCIVTDVPKIVEN